MLNSMVPNSNLPVLRCYNKNANIAHQLGFEPRIIVLETIALDRTELLVYNKKAQISTLGHNQTILDVEPSVELEGIEPSYDRIHFN